LNWIQPPACEGQGLFFVLFPVFRRAWVTAHSVSALLLCAIEVQPFFQISG
jgi:hypothetical protein